MASGNKAKRDKPKTDTPEPTDAERDLAAQGNQITDPDQLREIAAAQMKVLKSETDPANDEQPGETIAEVGDPVDRDTLPDPERPNVFSSQDMRSSRVNPARLHDPTTAGTTTMNREPTATEAKLAKQGSIPPIR